MEGMDFSGKSGKEGWTNIGNTLAGLGFERFCSRFEARFFRKPFRYKLYFLKFVIFTLNSMKIYDYLPNSNRLHEIFGLALLTRQQYISCSAAACWFVTRQRNATVARLQQVLLTQSAGQHATACHSSSISQELQAGAGSALQRLPME